MPRSKAYEPDEVLQQAMQLFWIEGFETTSIPKLEKHLGINRFSIYDTFGSKRNLFLRVLDSYTNMVVDTLVRPLENGTGGHKNLDRFFSAFGLLFFNPRRSPGCLLCNTATELGNRDKKVAQKVKAYFDRLETAILDCLLRAKKQGEIKSSRSGLENRARVGRACVQGILVDLRLGRKTAEIQHSLEVLKTYLVST